jgi:hypothetical protein
VQGEMPVSAPVITRGSGLRSRRSHPR